MNHTDFVLEGNELFEFSSKQTNDMYYQLSMAFYKVACDILDKEISMYDGDRRMKLISNKQRIQNFVNMNKEFVEDRRILHVGLSLF